MNPIAAFFREYPGAVVMLVPMAMIYAGCFGMIKAARKRFNQKWAKSTIHWLTLGAFLSLVISILVMAEADVFGLVLFWILLFFVIKAFIAIMVGSNKRY